MIRVQLSQAKYVMKGKSRDDVSTKLVATTMIDFDWVEFTMIVKLFIEARLSSKGDIPDLYSFTFKDKEKPIQAC